MKTAASSRRGALRQAVSTVVESLEQRKLFAVSPTQIGISFQPWGSEANSGYLTDSGEAYGTQQFGYDYGWDTAISSGNLFERSASKPQKQETGVITSTGNDWEISIPNGTYIVRLMAGDANITSGTYKYNVEGTTNFINGTAGSGNARWVSATGEVVVSDGKLTIQDNGGTQHRLAFVDIVLKSDKNSGTVGAPTNLVATPRLSTFVDLRWVDNANNENFDGGYEIQRRVGSGSWSTLSTTDGGIRQHGVDYLSVSPSTQYSYRVRAIRTNTSGVTIYSGWSNEVTTTTPANDTQAAYGGTNAVVPTIEVIGGVQTVKPMEAENYDKGASTEAYSDTTGANAGGFYRAGSIDVGLHIPSNTYYVGWIKSGEWQEYTVNVGDTGTYYAIAQVSSPGQGGTWKLAVGGTDKSTGNVVKDTGGFHIFQPQSTGTFSLTAGTGQVFRFQATGEDATSKFVGNFDSFTIHRFDAPTVNTPSAPSSAQINLTWTNNHTGPGSNLIYRRVSGASTWGSPVATVASTATSYSDTDSALVAGTTYEYMIRGERELHGTSPVSYGQTADSNTVSIALPSGSGVPNAPTSLAAAQNGSAVALTWHDNSTNETGFTIERSLSNLFTSPTTFTPGANATSYSDTTTAASTTYYYRIKATNGSGSSSWSSTASITTAAAIVTNLTVGADAYVRNGTYASTNYGTDAEMQVKYATSSGFAREAFTKFSLSAISDPVTQARLWIYGTKNSALDASMQIQARGVSTTSWAENTINYNTKPSIGGTALATVTLTNDTSYHWYAFDVTDYVQGELAASRTTVSLALVGTASSDAYLSIRSLNYNAGSHAPYLQVTTSASSATVPDAPSGLGAGTITTGSVVLNWTDNADDETGFKVQRRQGGGAWSEVSGSPTAADAVTFTDSSVVEGQSYDYRIVATNAAGDSTASNSITVNIPPLAASALSVTSTTPSSVSLSWTDNSSNETGYRIERRPHGTTTYATIDTVSANTTTYIDDDAVLEDGRQYDYRVRAYANADGSASNGVVATLPLVAPTGLMVTSVIPNGEAVEVGLAWVDVSTNDSSYQVQRGVGGSWTTLTPALLASTFLTDETAAADSVYDYRIRASNGIAGAESSWVTVTGVSTSPGAPTNLTVTAATDSSISIAWTDNSTTETAYRVERRASGTLIYATISSDLPSGTTTFSDTEVEEGVQYDYRVRAVNGAGDGAPAGPVQAWTKLHAPTAAEAQSVSATSIVVRWADESAKETSYAVDYSTSATFASGVTTVTAPANATERLLTGLTAGTTYYARIRAINADTESGYASSSASTLGTLSITRSPSGNPNEGTQLTFTASYALGTVSEDATYAWTVLKNGVAVPGGAVSATGNTATYTPDDNGIYTASVVVTTLFGQTDNASLSPSVSVVNVAPTLTAIGDQSVLKDQPYPLTLTATDPGSADTIHWTINWGDGQTENYAGRSLAPTHEYAVAGDYTISISASDGSTTATPTPSTIDIAVTEALLPTVTLAGADFAVVDEPYLLSIAVENEGTPGITSYLIDWGDGSDPDNDSQVGEVVTDISGPISHTYETDGSYEIHVLADSLYSAEPKEVTVIEEHVVPGVTLTGNSSATSGTPYSLSISTPISVASWIINWGDGTTETRSGQSSLTATHTYNSSAESVAITVSAEGVDGSVGAGWKRITLASASSGGTPTITNFATESTVSEGIWLNWAGSETAKEFELSRNGVILGRFVAGRFEDRILAPGAYQYTLVAYDEEGNASSPSTITANRADNQAPIMPAKARIVNYTSTHTTLQWEAAVDDGPIASYKIRNAIWGTDMNWSEDFIATVDGNTLTCTVPNVVGPNDLRPGGFLIYAVDAAGNIST